MMVDMRGLACGTLCLGIAGCLLGCGPAKSDRAPAAPAEPWFVEITREAGLDFVHDAGPVGDYFLPQVMGSGAAVFDFDGDGRLDIYLVQNAGPNSASRNRLFRQLPDGRFKDVSAGSGLDIAGWNMGVAVGDVNNDGRPDVLVTQYGGCRLFLNNGDGTFTDVTQAAGLDNPLWGSSAAFFDYDRDGWLDLVIVNYLAYDRSVDCFTASGRKVFCHPNSFQPTVTKLFRNLGRQKDPPGVRFEDVTVRSGLYKQAGPGLGVYCADFNGDGWPDIFVANDSKPNHLWINRRDGTFVEEALQRGLACNRVGLNEANMGVAVGDVNGDGLFDVFVTHLTEETNTLWLQRPRGMFRDATVSSGLASPTWRGTGFGTVLADFNHDGHLDLAVVNGRVTEPRAANVGERSFWSVYAERNQLFVNDGKGRFGDISPENEPFCGRAEVSRGLVCADIDGDGALDLLVTTVAGPARLFRNVAPRRGHWLKVRAVDSALKRDAYGAEITAFVGDRQFRRIIQPGYSYQCSNDPAAHFGLGDASRVDRLRVLWPDGSEEQFAGQPTDQSIVLRKGEGQKPGPGGG
jgi:hypothetical protein